MKKSIGMLALGLAVTSMAACGNDDKGDAEPITHAQTQQALTANAKNMGLRISTAATFVDRSDLLRKIASGDALDLNPGETTTCVDDFCEDGSGPMIDIPEIEGASADMEGFAEQLNELVFHEDQVESSSGSSVTYLIDGARACGADADPGCAAPIDDAEIRVRVTSPADGDLDLDLLIGPNRDNPISGSIHSNLIAVELDLGGLKGSAEHLASLTGGDVSDIPGTLEGRVRAELRSDSDDHVAVALSVLSAINVADGSYTFSMAPKSPAIELTANGATETLGLLVDIGAIDLTAPYIVNDFGADGSEIAADYAAELHLGGISSTTVLSENLISISDIGLGDETTSFKLDGKEVLAIDFNENNGRRLEVSAELDANDALKATLGSALDLVVKTDFEGIVGFDVEPSMIKETLRVLVDGASAPEMLMNENGLKMLAGNLTVSAQEANLTLTVSEGQCLLPVEEVIDGPILHPLEELAGSACE